MFLALLRLTDLASHIRTPIRQRGGRFVAPASTAWQPDQPWEAVRPYPGLLALRPTLSGSLPFSRAVIGDHSFFCLRLSFLLVSCAFLVQSQIVMSRRRIMSKTSAELPGCTEWVLVWRERHGKLDGYAVASLVCARS